MRLGLPGITAPLAAAAQGTIVLTGRAAASAARLPLRAAPAVAKTRTVAEALPQQVAWQARSLLDLHPRREHRRVWVGDERAHIEVRGLSGSGPRHRRLAGSVKRRLAQMQGVRWAEVNAVTGQVLVAFDHGKVDVGSILETVRSVEEAHGTRHEDFPWSRPAHPADPAAVTTAAVELAADCVSVAAALVGRYARLPAVPRDVRAVLALLETQPRLRQELKRRLGPAGRDLVLALASAVVQGLTHGPATPAVDALYRLELLAETMSRRAVWVRREDELCCTAQTLPQEATERPPRPRPLPPGPIETYAERAARGTLALAGGVLALTRDPGRGADAILVAVPKASRLGREGFATTVARQLAGAGVIPMNAAAYRRLDRMSAIVVDSAVLCTTTPQILAAEATVADVDDAAVWRAANRVLHGVKSADLAGPGPWRRDRHRLARPAAARTSSVEDPRALRLVLYDGRRRVGRVTVGCELDPLADAMLAAARSTGHRVLLTDHASVAELLPRADEVLPDDESLVDHVRRLQAGGDGVLVVSGHADDALAVADVGVAVLGRGECVCWSADLICGPGLLDVWRLLHAVAVARPNSERAVHLAQAGSALGALLALVGSRRATESRALTPVYSAALVALLNGTLAGIKATRRPPPQPVPHVPWHALEAADVLARLDESRATATAQRAARPPVGAAVASARAVGRELVRRPVLAQVTAPVRGGVALATAVRQELQDPLTPVLAVGATASAMLGSSVDALLVGSVMGGNALISGAQRLRAESTLRRLLLDQEVPARRLLRTSGADGGDNGALAGLDSVPLERVPARSLAAGDVIALRASDVVPADARLLSAVDLEVDESSLTGESVPVEKSPDATPTAPLQERTCMVFEGTTVLAGSAYAVVVATGDATEAGRAAQAAGRAAPPAGVQARLGDLTRVALPVTAIGGGAVTGLALLRRAPLREAVASGVAIAVAAVPEGLPLVATVAQLAAARRLSRRGALVRSSRTLEALGRVDTVCFDKTGTLTEGRLAVARLADLHGDIDVDTAETATAGSLLAVAARACPQADPGDVRTLPHATDRAVLAAAHARLNGDIGGWQLRSEVPFETSRGYSAALGEVDGQPSLAVKGAPEIVIDLCTTAVNGDGAVTAMTDARRRTAQETVQRLAADGLRVIAVAERTDAVIDVTGDPDVEDMVAELTLLGFIGIADMPRPGAAAAVEALRAEGVHVTMVTGDHPLTAAAIARAVGIPDEHVLTGADLDTLTERQRVERIAQATVVARVSPEQKVRIVEALQRCGRVVAMTGDGSNDAAAIRLADVGIGVAGRGSTAARSAADLVLADAGIESIHDALLEGRAMWRRVRDAVAILVGGNAGEVAFTVLGTALSGRAPINTRQVLLVNMLTDMFPALAVALAPTRQRGNGEHADPADEGPAESMLDASLARAIAVRGTATTLGATGAWLVGRYTGRRRRAATMGLAALVATQLGQTLLAGWHSPLVVGTAAASAGLLVAVVETPGVSQFFGCTPIGPVAWSVVLGSAAGATATAALAPRLIAPAVARGATE